MKNIFILPVLLTLSLAACHSGGDDKNAKLASLKKQESEIRTKIQGLQTNLDSIQAQEKALGLDSAGQAFSVGVIALKPEIFKNFIDIQGKIDADENVTLSTEMPGTITKINVKVGDEVHAGQVLAETDARAINQQISDMQTNMDLVNQLYDKQKNLWDQKIGTEIQFLQAKTNKESMGKKMAALQEQVRMSKIISPINGNVDAVDLKLGQTVSPGMAAIRVINYANLKVKADVAESYASKIKKGTEAIVRFPDTNDSVLAKVNFVSRAINPTSRTFNVEVLLDDKTEYHPNMIARLSINDYQSATPVLVVPINVVQKDENGASFVFTTDGKTAKKQIVSVGKQYNGKSEVLSGLKDGDRVISSGYDLINDGDPVLIEK